jgi:hypothetical protein
MSELSKTTLAEPERVAFAAIDWANRKHFWRLLPAGSQRYEEGELDNTPEAIEVWATNLQRRFGGRPIAVCLEQSRGPLVYTLTKIPAPGAVPGTPHYRSALPRDILPVRSQERSP